MERKFIKVIHLKIKSHEIPTRLYKINTVDQKHAVWQTVINMLFIKQFIVNQTFYTYVVKATTEELFQF